MNDPTRTAQQLMDDSFACPAAILVALIDDPKLSVLNEDIAHLGTLSRLGCLSDGKVTPYGQQVGTVLRNVHGVQAWPHWARD